MYKDIWLTYLLGATRTIINEMYMMNEKAKMFPTLQLSQNKEFQVFPRILPELFLLI